MSNDIKQTITRIAEIIINELKLEDVTPETFNPDLDLIDEVGGRLHGSGNRRPGSAR